MASKKVLGRGLGAFFPDYEHSGGDSQRDTESKNNTSVDPQNRVNTVIQLPLQNIRPNKHQPRKAFNEERLQELADSIATHGLIQPITVRYIGENRFELISGERRWRASKLAGQIKIPAYVREVNDEDVISFALIENIQREDLNPIEVALGYQRLIDEVNYTQAQVAERVGKNRSTVTNSLRLLQLPDFIQASLRDGRISMGHARAIIAIENKEHQREIFEEVIEHGYSVRQIEDAVRRLNESKKTQHKQPKPSVKSDEYAPMFNEIKNRLRRTLNTKVHIKPKKQGGEIRIEYYNEGELERIMDIFDSIG